MVDVEGMSENLILGGFKPTLLPLLPPNIDFDEETLADALFGMKVKMFVVKRDGKSDNIHKMEVVQN